jgi:hypothetical protein
MKTENKEMQLIIGIAKLTVNYLDYILLFFLFPVIFDTEFAGVQSFIALGTMLVLKAIMPVLNSILSDDKVIISEKGYGNSYGTRQETPPTPAPVEVEKGEVIAQAKVDGTNPDLKMIRFGRAGQRAEKDGPDQINIKRIEDEIVVSFSDFRTLRLKKDEIYQLYKSLFETEYTFFKPGHWTTVIKVIKQT